MDRRPELAEELTAGRCGAASLGPLMVLAGDGALAAGVTAELLAAGLTDALIPVPRTGPALEGLTFPSDGLTTVIGPELVIPGELKVVRRIPGSRFSLISDRLTGPETPDPAT